MKVRIRTCRVSQMKVAFASLAVWGLLSISNSFRMAVVDASAKMNVMLQDTETTQTGTATALALVGGGSQSLLENHSGHMDYQHHMRNLSNSFGPWATRGDYDERFGFGKIMGQHLLLIMFQKGRDDPVVFTISSLIGSGSQGEVFRVACVACVEGSKECSRHLALKHFLRSVRYSSEVTNAQSEVDALTELNRNDCRHIPTLVAFGEIYGLDASLRDASVNITPPEAPDPPSGGFFGCLGGRGRAEPTEAGTIKPNCFERFSEELMTVTPKVALMSLAPGSPLLTWDSTSGVFKRNVDFNPSRHSKAIEAQLLEFQNDMLKSGYVHGDLHYANVHWDKKQITVLDFGKAKKVEASANYTAGEEMDFFLWKMSHEHISEKGAAWQMGSFAPFRGIGLKLSADTMKRLSAKFQKAQKVSLK